MEYIGIATHLPTSWDIQAFLFFVCVPKDGAQGDTACLVAGVGRNGFLVTIP